MSSVTRIARSFIVISLLLSVSAYSKGQNHSSAAEPGWKLVWADEFNGRDGSRIDLSKWSIITGGKGFGNKELESYMDRIENLRQVHVNLVIEARREPYTGPDGIARDCTSARIESRGKFEQIYGRFEARMKLSRGKGMWPAFWMLGNDIKSKGWPACGEIDIMENIGGSIPGFMALSTDPGTRGHMGSRGTSILLRTSR